MLTELVQLRQQRRAILGVKFRQTKTAAPAINLVHATVILVAPVGHL